MIHGEAQTVSSPRRPFDVFAAAVGVALTAVLGLFVPGLGIVVGAAIAFVGYRHQRAMRNAFLALGVAITLVAVLAAVGVRSGGSVPQPQRSPGVRVSP